MEMTSKDGETGPALRNAGEREDRPGFLSTLRLTAARWVAEWMSNWPNGTQSSEGGQEEWHAVHSGSERHDWLLRFHGPCKFKGRVEGFQHWEDRTTVLMVPVNSPYKILYSMKIWACKKSWICLYIYIHLIKILLNSVCKYWICEHFWKHYFTFKCSWCSVSI